jgi:hypothetical protein
MENDVFQFFLSFPALIFKGVLKMAVGKLNMNILNWAVANGCHEHLSKQVPYVAASIGSLDMLKRLREMDCEIR